MTKQFNIRNDKAYELAVHWSGRLGMPMHKVVEEALTAFDAAQPKAKTQLERWYELLEKDWELLSKSTSTFEIDDMYDEDGLPI